MFCHVAPENVMSVHDVSNIFRVPLLLHDQGLESVFARRLQLKLHASDAAIVGKWSDIADKYDKPVKRVKVVLVGKYMELRDTYLSVIKALEHASMELDRKLDLHILSSDDLLEGAEPERCARSRLLPPDC